MIRTYDSKAVELSIEDLKIDHDFADLCRAQMGEVRSVIEFESTWPPPCAVDETIERDLEGSWLWQ